MGHLHPDLVPPAGQKPDLNQTPSPAFFQNPVGQAAFLRSRRIRRTDAGPVLPGVLRQVIHQHAFFFRKFSTYQGPIPFFHTCVIRCLPAQIRRRITIFRHQQDSLHRLVQPVHQPELYLLPPRRIISFWSMLIRSGTVGRALCVATPAGLYTARRSLSSYNILYFFIFILSRSRTGGSGTFTR